MTSDDSDFELAVPKRKPDKAYERDSFAVVACDGNGNGVVLWTAGPYLAEEMDNAGSHRLDDIGLDDAPEGISVWEGKYTWVPGGDQYPLDGSTEPRGKFRPPTDEEWAAIRRGECPWNDGDWYDAVPQPDAGSV